MSEKESSWKFAEDLVTEPEVIAETRRVAQELGVESVTPATGAQLAVLAATSRARAIAEIGTGVGVSGLWMLTAAPDAVLTTIDAEADHHQAARQAFASAGVPANRTRLITGRALDVLPRMNEDSYDVVVVDADAANVIAYVEHALRLVRTGGTVVVVHALWRGKVADPVQRDAVVRDFRYLATEIASSDAVVSALSPVGDGLLQMTKLGR